MSLKLKLILITVLIIFLFPQKIKAAMVLYYLTSDDSGNDYFTSKRLGLNFAMDKEDRAFILFNSLFTHEDETFIPEGTEVISVNIEDDLLILNVSEDIKNYGGTYHELCLTSEIMKNASQLYGINKITLLIEGEPDYLPEGTLILEQQLYE